MWPYVKNFWIQWYKLMFFILLLLQLVSEPLYLPFRLLIIWFNCVNDHEIKRLLLVAKQGVASHMVKPHDHEMIDLLLVAKKGGGLVMNTIMCARFVHPLWCAWFWTIFVQLLYDLMLIIISILCLIKLFN